MLCTLVIELLYVTLLNFIWTLSVEFRYYFSEIFTETDSTTKLYIWTRKYSDYAILLLLLFLFSLLLI